MDGKWKIESSAKWKVQEEKWWQLEIGFFLSPNLPATSISSSPTFEVPRIQSPEPMYLITSQKRQMGDTDPEKYGNWVRCIPLQLVCACVCMESCYTFMSIFATSTPLAHENSPSRAEILHPCRISSRIYNYYSYPVTRNHDTEMTMITIS